MSLLDLRAAKPVGVGVLKLFDLVYVGTPYTLFPGGLDAAYDAAADVCHRLKEAGVQCYSPILYTHPLAKTWGVDPKNHEFWIPFDETMMRKADAFAAAALDSWEESYGLSVEYDFFDEAQKPIFLLDPETMEVRS